MFQSFRFKLGFTLTEILVVISIIMIVSGFLVGGFQNYASYQQYNQAVGDIQFVLNQARTDARSAVSDVSHGIKIEATSITHFEGNTYVFGAPTNEVINYKLVTLSASLSSGGDEIIFNKLTGIPSATGTVTVTGSFFSASTSISITNSGVIQ